MILDSAERASRALYDLEQDRNGWRRYGRRLTAALCGALQRQPDGSYILPPLRPTDDTVEAMTQALEALAV